MLVKTAKTGELSILLHSLQVFLVWKIQVCTDCDFGLILCQLTH